MTKPYKQNLSKLWMSCLGKLHCNNRLRLEMSKETEVKQSSKLKPKKKDELTKYFDLAEGL